MTQPAAIRVAGRRPEQVVVWLTVLGAFSSPIFLPLTAWMVDEFGWRDSLRVQAAVAAATFLLATAPRARARPGGAWWPGTRVADVLAEAWRLPSLRRWVLASMVSGIAIDVILVYQVRQ